MLALGGCAHDLLQGAGNGTRRAGIILNQTVMGSDGIGMELDGIGMELDGIGMELDGIGMELGFWLEGEFG